MYLIKLNYFITAMVINFFYTFIKYFIVVFSKAKNSNTELFTLIEATCLLQQSGERYCLFQKRLEYYV